MNDLVNARDDADDDRDASDRRARDALPGAASLVCITTTIGTYPITAKAVYGLRIGVVTGTDREGQPVTITATGDTFTGSNLGNAIPPVGTPVRVDQDGGRYLFDY